MNDQDLNSLTRKDIFQVLKNQLSLSKINDTCFTILKNELSKKFKKTKQFTEDEKISLRKLISEMIEKWQEVHRVEKIFPHKYPQKSIQVEPEKILTGDEALVLMVENQFPKSQYTEIKSVSHAKNCKLYASYNVVLDAKKRCYPLQSEITVTKSSASVMLQELLSHIIDVQRQGYGTTNNGNTARRFFQNTKISASITGIDKDFIQRFHTIPQVLSCGFEVRIIDFEK